MYPMPIDSLPKHRRRVAEFIESPSVTRIIIGLILLNAITLGLETNSDLVAVYGALLKILDTSLLSIFTLEIAAKLYAYRLRFFKSGWNVFDFLIVTIAWVPASGPLSVLRAFRVLRILRLLSVVPQMRRVITALGHSIPGMSSVIGVLVLIFYVCAVLATKLFGQHPDPNMQEWFGTIGASAYTLFQIMTLESWSMGIVRPTMELYPWSWLFFVPFIVITSFAVLNLFIGIIVDAMQMAQAETRNEDKQEIKTFTHEEVDSLQTQIQSLNATMQTMQQGIDRLQKQLIDKSGQ
ncbi:MAG: ion transporter [Pseudomonadales bacterium]|nr:ion transporter [Pseudomonadales bacterium]